MHNISAPVLLLADIDLMFISGGLIVDLRLDLFLGLLSSCTAVPQRKSMDNEINRKCYSFTCPCLSELSCTCNGAVCIQIKH